MNIILLSGGSGKRLWPLSNDVRSKQFIKLFKTEYGKYQSMVQRVYGQIKTAIPDAKVTIATAKSQVSSIINQLDDEVGISVEPCRRDTFPAIVLAAAYLQDVQGVSADEPVVICPVDPYVGDDYFQAIAKLGELAGQGNVNLSLMGIEPTYPSEKYGYIIPESADKVSVVKTFKEKPDEAAAKAYIAQGALWNGGIFACKLSYLLNKAHKLIDFDGYEDLVHKYNSLEKISFDYAVVEREPKIQVMRFQGEWKDLGTWNTLSEAMEEHSIGKAVLEDTCDNVHVINELGVPILALGLHDVVISASPEGILVSDKDRSSHIKPMVEKLSQQIMFAEKSWGSYRVLDADEASMTIKVTLNPGKSMNYHNHKLRDEVWVVTGGHGRALLDDKMKNIKAGDVLTMSAGCKHAVFADTELKLVEVQLGRDISVKDKEKFAIKSDAKCFGGADIRGIYPLQVNEQLSYRIGRSYPQLFDAKRVVVGCDARLSGPALKKELVRGLLDAGCTVLDIGQCGTEMIYFATSHLKLDGGIMVTASHNDGEYNGFKLVRENSIPLSKNSGLRELESLCATPPLPVACKAGSVENYDIMPAYISHLLSYIDIANMKPLRVVANASNGTAGIVLNELEKYLPLSFIRVQCEPDGYFPEGAPNPMRNESREITACAVREHQADAGIAWDGDFDRCFLFDENGVMIEGYYMVGLLAEAFLRKNSGSRIIHDPRVYWNTQDICRAQNGEAVMSQSGHSFIKEKMREVDAVYGGEMSSHHYFRDFSYCDSGMLPWLLVLEMLSLSGRKVSELVKERVDKFPCSGEINTQVASVEGATKIIAEIEGDYAGGIIDHVDGLSVSFDTWRFNLRKSNTEPVIRLNVETRGDKCLLREKTEELLNKIRRQS